MSQMGLAEFYREVARRAISGKFWYAEKISGGFALFFGLLGFFDGWEKAVIWVPVLSFAAVFVGTVVVGLFIAPYRMWCEQERMVHERDSALTPRLKIERLCQLPEDLHYYILVHNLSQANSLSNCLVRIESVTDGSGRQLLSYWPLRTETQTGGRPEGRFNLDSDQRKPVLLCEPLRGGSFAWRIIGAENRAKKLASGQYMITVRATAQVDTPIEAVISLSGSEIHIDSISPVSSPSPQSPASLERGTPP